MGTSVILRAPDGKNKKMNFKKSDEIELTRLEVYWRDGDQCQYIDKDGNQCNVRGYDNLVMAHRIHKGNKKFVVKFWASEYKQFITLKQAKAILNHPINLMTSCADHNSYFNCAFSTKIACDILRQIKEDLNEKSNAIRNSP